MEFNKVYFFTATIKNWIPIFQKNGFKEIVLSSLKYLADKNLVKVYGFVIMPNHIHLIWELKEMNGKESPKASFLKFTAHSFLKKIRKEDPKFLQLFAMEEENRDHIFWQEAPLSIEIYSPKVIFQKLEYIHSNTCKGKWMLSSNPINYPYSSMGFYETGIDQFGFLTHIGERI